MTRVTFEGARYPLHEGESVLDGMLRGGANLSFSCRRGSCQVCLLRATHGEPGEQAQKGVREAMRARGYFLPCMARPSCDLHVEKPDLSELFVRAMVSKKETLAPDVVRLSLEPETNLTWRAGQYVNVRRADGLVRSYSIASVQSEDYFLELHVERIGQMSRFLCDELAEGDEVEIQGPVGDCFYDPATRARPMLLIGTGTGLAPLVGIAREALLAGHEGEIFLHHGARTHEKLYMQDELRALAERFPNFHYVPSVSGEAPKPGVAAGRATDVAFARNGDLRGFVAFFCGKPEVVEAARIGSFRAGIDRRDVHADPFEPSHPYMPDDSKKLKAIPGDPELWKALGEGTGLNAILHDFYGRVYEDPRLAPFFHKVTKQRAIEKQYEFLAGLFTGEQKYFGLNPFNAHHWMVISDELFDYRERLMDECIRRYGLPEHLIRRWGAIHETFRRELVKSSARGLILGGVEQPVEGWSDEVTLIATICDGCGNEMLAGARGRMHVRTGQLFCEGCSARKVGMTIPPAA